MPQNPIYYFVVDFFQYFVMIIPIYTLIYINCIYRYTHVHPYIHIREHSHNTHIYAVFFFIYIGYIISYSVMCSNTRCTHACTLFLSFILFKYALLLLAFVHHVHAHIHPYWCIMYTIIIMIITRKNKKGKT